ncbi:MAG: hypothetical protein HY235_01170 [Acidobacteria bacterium]|nr:hypothetical protein [Acidobacteriota bacterium]
MSLWIDGGIPSVTDLQQWEQGVFNMATTEGINLDEKIRLGRAEVQTLLMIILKEKESQAVAESTIGSVVVTEALKRLATYHTLALTYRDAHFNQVSERYKGKWEEYRRLASEAKAELSRTGIGIVRTPLNRPAQPQIAAVAGSLPAGSYFISICWTDGVGSESEASEIRTLVTTQASGISITPAGAPAGATGWHVFAGTVEDVLWQQNTAPLPIPGNWVSPGSSLVIGRAPGTGQEPDSYVVQDNRFWRG